MKPSFSMKALCAVAALMMTGLADSQPAFAAGENGYAPVAVVNDQIITGYDVDQRTRILSAAGARGTADNLREQALKELINDTLRLAAARRAGIAITAADIDSGFEAISRNNGQDPERMRSYFLQQGVDRSALEKQISAEVAWQRVVQARYRTRVNVDESEIDEVLGDVSGGAETEYLLAEIRIPIGASGEAGAQATAQQVLRQVAQSGDFASVARRVSSGPTAALGGDLGWVAESSMSVATQGIVSKLSKDRVSPPYRDGDSVVILGLRDVREPGAIVPARYRLSQIVVPVERAAPQSVADAALERARQVRPQLGDCAVIEQIKANYSPISGTLGELTLAQLPGPVRDAVSTLGSGQVSEPVRSNDGFHLIMVCEKIEPTSGLEADRERARRVLIGQKLERYARSFLSELRRSAVIERR